MRRRGWCRRRCMSRRCMRGRCMCRRCMRGRCMPFSLPSFPSSSSSSPSPPIRPPVAFMPCRGRGGGGRGRRREGAEARYCRQSAGHGHHCGDRRVDNGASSSKFPERTLPRSRSSRVRWPTAWAVFKRCRSHSWYHEQSRPSSEIERYRHRTRRMPPRIGAPSADLGLPGPTSHEPLAPLEQSPRLPSLSRRSSRRRWP